MARALSKIRHRDDIDLIFFDGEEARGEWTDTDSVYGSRHLAAKWLADGTLSHLQVLINVDMIGDKGLDILNDANSSSNLREMMQNTAAKLGYAKYFRQDPGAIDDDHKPFADVGVNVLDVIDFDYGPRQAYWHTGHSGRRQSHRKIPAGTGITNLATSFRRLLSYRSEYQIDTGTL